MIAIIYYDCICSIVSINTSFLVIRAESQVFKSKFWGWDDVLAVDYTRSADTVSKVAKKLGTKVRWSESCANI